ncbi:DEAD/DEAH box helicase [Allofournierella massiliensis]|uniref:ATP-dependent RNA helicase CshA n=1 Tax=Allofournierella massiliensis TaxID=1650663 RepID=A0A4R1R5I7_9FIRM|nr:DEAD/DEAH box helicase [Fournierella massiliensis]TCL60786.1 ATP-dependent RNA helicase RhlE [Fournierella massiliensis]
MNFSELKLTRPLLKAVEEQGYKTPSPIQAKAIPPVLAGYDLLGCAQTGTGKTAAFALPILQRLAASHPSHKGVRALILTPTRELALQIDECFANYGRYLNVSHCVVFGGVGQQPQVDALRRGADVLTACPGRLNDLIGQGHVDLSRLEIFVLDEADRMLDMGFVNDVKKVIRHLPAQRQNLLFSATMPKEIEQLANSILKKPVTVKVDPVSSTVERIEQGLYFVNKPDKKRLLAKLLADPAVTSALVFSRTKHGANAIATFLNKQGIGAAAIHGNKSQSARVAALDSFKAGKIRALVATDIAARGIDISELSHVFNFDLPEVPETYVHRIGRTGRAGAEGVAISFCSPEEKEYLAGIEKLNRKKIPMLELPELGERAETAAPARPAPRPEREKAKPEQPKRKETAKQAPNEPANQQLEVTIVEEKNTQAGQPLSASAKRRRRRRRAAGKAAEAAAQENAKREERGERPERPERNERPAEKAQKQPAKQASSSREKAQSGRGQQRSAARPEHSRQTQRTSGRSQQQKSARAEKQPRQAAPAKDEDPGLLLISRKPPAQKFASFEEYMKSHGGFSEPIEGEAEE